MHDFYEDASSRPTRGFETVLAEEFEKLYQFSQCPECKNISHKNFEFILKEKWGWHEEQIGGESYYVWCQCRKCAHDWSAVHSKTLKYVTQYFDDGTCEEKVVEEEDEVVYDFPLQSKPKEEIMGHINSALIEKENENMIKIFISHSSKDQEMVSLIADLLLRALDLKAENIRCTSVSGFKLPTGVHASTQLKNELNGCSVVMGVLTQNSLISSYVMFELGAGWVLGKHVVPIIGTDISFPELPPPLSEQNSIEWNNRNGWEQLVEDLSRILNLNKNNISLFSPCISKLIDYKPSAIK